jgi:23S rRNA pseudouridine1911/1915/1917 synthase
MDYSKKKVASQQRAKNKKDETKAKVRAKAFAKADAGRTKKTNKTSSDASGDERLYEGASRPVKNSEKMEKAYKLLALQESISNSQAKTLIDRGLVYVANRKVSVARGELPLKTTFNVQEIATAKVIYEDNNLLVVDKPAFLNTDEVERQYPDAQLLHRLDRETSGVLILVKDEEYRLKAISEFKRNKVYKEYTAWVEGMFIDETEIDKAILTEKRHNKAFSKISPKGKPAHTTVTPVEVVGKYSKVKVVIQEGRTHQIRCHLRSIGFPIAGDEQYGGRHAKRMMLHAYKVELLGKTFIADEPKIFAHYSS